MLDVVRKTDKACWSNFEFAAFFFDDLCLNNVTDYRFGGKQFWQKICSSAHNITTIGISALFQNKQKWTFSDIFKVLSRPDWCLLSGPSLCTKKHNLALIKTLVFCSGQHVVSYENVHDHYFIMFSKHKILNLAQLISFKMGKFGPNCTLEYMYIYIYIYTHTVVTC